MKDTRNNWRADISDLREHAKRVQTPSLTQDLHAISVVQCLSGIIGLGAIRYSLDTMQRACADLVRAKRAWETTLGELPRDHTGRVPEPIVMVAAVARGLYPIAGAENLRAGIAFWAVESDPAVWMSIAV
jgi:hypothetical protein